MNMYPELTPEERGNRLLWQLGAVAPASCGGRRLAPALNRNSSTGAHRRLRLSIPWATSCGDIAGRPSADEYEEGVEVG